MKNWTYLKGGGVGWGEVTFSAIRKYQKDYPDKHSFFMLEFQRFTKYTAVLNAMLIKHHISQTLFACIRQKLIKGNIVYTLHTVYTNWRNRCYINIMATSRIT